MNNITITAKISFNTHGNPPPCGLRLEDELDRLDRLDFVEPVEDRELKKSSSADVPFVGWAGVEGGGEEVLLSKPSSNFFQLIPGGVGLGGV